MPSAYCSVPSVNTTSWRALFASGIGGLLLAVRQAGGWQRSHQWVGTPGSRHLRDAALDPTGAVRTTRRRACGELLLRGVSRRLGAAVRARGLAEHLGDAQAE